MAELRVGFIGCGNHATQNLYPALRYAGLDLAAVCDLDKRKAQRVARQFGAHRAYQDFSTMLDEMELDAVLVCGPPELHFEAALAALERGCHVWIEKPPAPSLAETEQLAAYAAQAGRIVQDGFMMRFAPAYVRLKEIIETEEVGRPSLIEAKYCCSNVSSVRHHLIHYGVHILDLMRHLMGDVTELSALKCERGGQVANAISLRFASGAVGLVNFSSLQPRVQERVEVTGENAVAVVDNRVNLEYHPPGSRESREGSCWRPDFAIPGQSNSTLELQGYAPELSHFAACVRGEAEPAATIADGVAAMRLLDLIEQNQGEVVQVGQTG